MISEYQESSEVDVLIIGAGIVGLAAASQISRLHSNLRVLLVEKNRRYGQEISSRNSEVIHAGMYYPQASLKAQLCVEGSRLLYEFCSRCHIKHERLGKIIIAVNHEEIESLRSLYRQGLENGVELEWLDEEKVYSIEPNVCAAAGIWSPNTGIIDSEGLMRCLYQSLHEQGVICLFNTEAGEIRKTGEGYHVALGRELIKTPVIINCAGLYSDKVAAMAGMDIDKQRYRLRYCKGEYYRLSLAANIKHLVYPLPEKGGLGIHISKDMAGGQRLGPNAYYVPDIDYNMCEEHKSVFFNAGKRYLPNLKIENLHPDYSGIRPKLEGENDEFRDFVIREESDHGFPGLINLIGIESPGLTSCLAIANYVCTLLESLGVN